MENIPLQGSCLCQAIHFTALGSMEASACHCEQCRNHCGGPFFSVYCHDFALQQGKEFLVEYQSSGWACRGFCAECGSSIYYKTIDDSFFGLSLGTIHRPKPLLTQHIYTDSAELNEHHQADFWDKLPKKKAKEFLDMIGLGELYTGKHPALGDLAKTEQGGGCLCNGVRFSVKGALDSVVVCHCGQCQTQTSSYYRATNVPDDLLHFSHDRTLKWHDSSPTAQRGFCSDCGSKLFWKGASTVRKNTPSNETTSILMGAFDARLPIAVSKHIYTQDASGAYPLP